MPEFTPRFNIPKPSGSDPIRGNTVDNLKIDMGQAADATELALTQLDDGKVGIGDPRLPQYAATDVVVVAVTGDDLQTWLGANKTDGGPSSWAQKVLQHYYGVTAVQDEHSMFSVVSDDHLRTDLTLDAEQGVLAEFVIQRMAPRIGNYLDLGAGAVGDRMMVDGQLVPAYPDTKNTTIWGSSTPELLAPFLAPLFKGELHAEAKSGERMEQIAARLGSTPALINTVTIPTSGSVVVSASNMLTNQYLKPFTGTLAGVAGTLSSTATEMTFTRTGTGTTVNVPAGTPFIPDVGNASRQHVTILDGGKNNVYDSGDVPAKVNTLFDQAFAYLSPAIKRVAVMTMFVDSNQTPGSTSYVNVKAINENRRNTYGDLVYDLEAYLLSPQLWVDAGITPTSTDLTQQANGVKPSSVSMNDGHLNTTGNTAVAKDFDRWKTARGW